MPRLARYKVSAVSELGRQLLYAPPETRRRHMDAAEALVEEIDPRRLYPAEFVVYRITGYRPDPGDEPVALVGEALLPDLVTLIQRLSESLAVGAGEHGRRAVRFDELPRRLGVSARTLQRYRREGLVCHYVVFADGVKRLACFEDALERFVDGHRRRVARAASFSRIPAETRDEIVAEARRLRAEEGLSLNTAARRLAARHRRAHETVRAILKRHDREAREPIFAETGPLGPRHGRLIHRAVGFGVPVGVLARHLGKTRATIHRALNRHRAALLRRLDLRYVELPIMGRPDAEPVVLDAPEIARGLDDLLPHHDALALLAAAHAAPEPPEDLERNLLAGYGLLKRRARLAIEGLGEPPSAMDLDEIETTLRWATLAKRRLVLLGLPEAIVAAERTLGRPLAECPAEAIADMLRRAVAVVGDVVETLDPRRAQRLAHASGFAMNRRLAARAAPPRGRAASRHEPDSVPLVGLLGALNPWQPWLELRRDLAACVDRLPEDAAALLRRRYGLDGRRPASVAELAAGLERPPTAVAAALHRAEGDLRRLRRATGKSSCP